MAYDAAAFPASLRRKPPTTTFIVESIGFITINTGCRMVPVSKLIQSKLLYNPPDTKRQLHSIARAAYASLTTTKYEALLLSTECSKLSVAQMHSWIMRRECVLLGVDGLMAMLSQCRMPSQVLGNTVYALGPASFWYHKTVGVIPTTITPNKLSYGVMARSICPQEQWHPHQHFVVFLPQS